MVCEQLFLRINPSRIWYLKFILEGYDGLASLSTVERDSGIVLLRFPGSNKKNLFILLGSLAAELRPL